jgi:hypothetical protein
MVMEREILLIVPSTTPWPQLVCSPSRSRALPAGAPRCQLRRWRRSDHPKLLGLFPQVSFHFQDDCDVIGD